MTTASQTISTPLIDAALPSARNAFRLIPEFAKTKALLLAAIEKGQIFNVDFQDAKRLMSNVVEAALHPSVTAFWGAAKRD